MKNKIELGKIKRITLEILTSTKSFALKQKKNKTHRNTTVPPLF